VFWDLVGGLPSRGLKLGRCVLCGGRNTAQAPQESFLVVEGPLSQIGALRSDGLGSESKLWARFEIVSYGGSMWSLSLAHGGRGQTCCDRV
jgi:hypothetical protein